MTSDSDSTAAGTTPAAVAATVRLMSQAQVRELIDILARASDPQKAPPDAGDELSGGDVAAGTSDSASKDTGAGNGLLAALGTGLTSVGSGAKSIASERDFWKSMLSNVAPWALALILAPIVVPWSFERDRAAAKPRISIEYAYLSRNSQEMPATLTQQVAAWTTQPAYRAFVQSRVAKGVHADIASFFVTGARLSDEMREQLADEAAAYKEYLDRLVQDSTDQQTRLASVTDEDLRSFAFDVLDNPALLDDLNPRSSLQSALQAKAQAASSMREEVSNLVTYLANVAPGVRLRLTLLNRGATDGLVRHHGEITYRGNVYPISRTAPPSADLKAMAVPVFQTNVSGDDYAAGSVGKIEQDSMAEFWFAFTPAAAGEQSSAEAVCRSGEIVEIVLFDQNRNEVRGGLECNQEEQEG